jgi:hypothetical protein
LIDSEQIIVSFLLPNFWFAAESLIFIILRLGYQMVAKPIQNTVVIDLSTTKSLANCLDETQTSSLKVRPCFALQRVRVFCKPRQLLTSKSYTAFAEKS